MSRRSLRLDSLSGIHILDARVTGGYEMMDKKREAIEEEIILSVEGEGANI